MSSEKHHQVLRLFDENVPPKDIATMTNYSTRQVYRVLKTNNRHLPKASDKILPIIESCDISSIKTLSRHSKSTMHDLSTKAGYSEKTIRRVLNSKQLRTFDGKKYKKIKTSNFNPDYPTEASIDRFVELYNNTTHKTAILTILNIDSDQYERIIKTTEFKTKLRKMKKNKDLHMEQAIYEFVFGVERLPSDLDDFEGEYNPSMSQEPSNLTIENKELLDKEPNIHYIIKVSNYRNQTPRYIPVIDNIQTMPEFQPSHTQIDF